MQKTNEYPRINCDLHGHVAAENVGRLDELFIIDKCQRQCAGKRDLNCLQSDGIAFQETRRKPGDISATAASQKTGSSTEQPKPAGEPSEEQSSQESDPSHSHTGRILACQFSPSGRYFALCDDYKTLSLYDTEGWHHLSTRTTQKRCMAIAFSHGEDSVYVAGKFGDVHNFSVSEPDSEGCLILGHLSMLLDMAVSPDGRYILTSDRDEKTRISCLPNAYNIHAFCLGHTEFVSRIAIVPGYENVLVTGGGDSTLRFWDYQKAKQLQCVSLQPHGREEDENQQQIVTGIACCRKHGLVAITVLGSPYISLHRLTTDSGSVHVTRAPSIDAQAVCWSACFDHLDRLWVLRQLQSQPLVVFSVVESSDGYSVQPLNSSVDISDVTSILNQLNSDWSFFESAVNTPSPYANLYKRSFDNTKAYLERKEKRIKEQQQKKSSKNLDCSSRLGKKAKLETEVKTVGSGS